MTEIEHIARVCHEANRAWCEANGDDSQRAWADAEDWQRESAINGVKFALANPDAAPSAQHNAWMQAKLDDGWTHGTVKDAEAKTHPCIVPYSDLPEVERAKDALFLATVRALAHGSVPPGSDMLAATAIAAYLDPTIRYWRRVRDGQEAPPEGMEGNSGLAVAYVDAFQSARVSILGSTLDIGA